MLVDVEAEMHMIRWMCSVSLKDRTREEMRKMVEVQHITTVIRSELRWYGHVMRKIEDWVKKCREYRVDGRRPAGRPRWT